MKSLFAPSSCFQSNQSGSGPESVMTVESELDDRAGRMMPRSSMSRLIPLRTSCSAMPATMDGGFAEKVPCQGVVADGERRGRVGDFAQRRFRTPGATSSTLIPPAMAILQTGVARCGRALAQLCRAAHRISFAISNSKRDQTECRDPGSDRPAGQCLRSSSIARLRRAKPSRISCCMASRKAAASPALMAPMAAA